jgi:hypothetical protein
MREQRWQRVVGRADEGTTLAEARGNVGMCETID